MPNCLEIISSRLLVSDMGINTSVPCSSCKIFTISEGNVLANGTLVTFSETKIDDINGIFSSFCTSNQKVVWLDVSMDNSLLMDDLDSLDHLDRDVENGADVELSSAFLEQVLE